MTATSHAITGAAIALAVKEPLLALPLAFVSHFVLDALPHIGLNEFGGYAKKKKLFHQILYIDATLLTIFMAAMFFINAPFLVFICIFLSGSPDVVWAYRYVFQENLGAHKQRAKNAFSRFHSRIQWSQTLKGSLFEVPYALIILFFVIIKL